MMQGELGAIVLGQGAAEFRRQGREPGAQLGGGWFGFAAGWPGEQDEARGAFLGDEDRLAIAAEQQIVGFPMAGLAACVDVNRAFCDGNAVCYMLDGTAALASAVATAGLCAGQIEPPVPVLGSADLA